MKKTISIILTLVLLFSALPLTALTAGAYEGYTQENICTWWDGKDIKFHTVDGAETYTFTFRRVLPYSDVSYETVSQNNISFKITNGQPDGFSVDGLVNPNFPALNAVKLSDGIITISVEKWLDQINANFAYTYFIIAYDQSLNEITEIQSDYVWGKDLKNGYKGVGGIVKLSGITDEGDAGIGSWITAEVTDCNIPVSKLQYTWKFFNRKTIDHYGELYGPRGTVIPGSGNDTTLKGADDSLIGNCACLVVTAEGYDGAFYSPMYCYTSEIKNISGTATSYLDTSVGATLLLFRKNVGFEVFDSYAVASKIDGSYHFSNLAAGAYRLTALKDNHVPRSYTITPSSNSKLDVKIHPIGDINGDGIVSTLDFGRANSHARGKSTLEGYEFDCADVTGTDKTVTTADTGKINSHARGKSKLW